MAADAGPGLTSQLAISGARRPNTEHRAPARIVTAGQSMAISLSPRVSGIALLGLTLMAQAGCGYSLGYREAPSVTSIAVPIFHNATFPLRRELEFALTSATREQIQTRTSLVLVDSDEADMVVKGTISDFTERVVAEGRNDEKLESRVLITVSLLVEDYQNEKRWEEKVRVDEPVSFDVGETIEIGRQRAIEDLAEKIVNTLDSWQ